MLTLKFWRIRLNLFNLGLKMELINFNNIIIYKKWILFSLINDAKDIINKIYQTKYTKYCPILIFNNYKNKIE
jgi:hypothetical protein